MERANILENLGQLIQADESLRFLPEWQIRCLLPMALGRSLSVISVEVGKPVAEIREAAKGGIFRQALAIAVQQTYQLSGELCAASTLEAVFYLREIMADKNVRTCDRIKAATVILDRGDISDRYQLGVRLKAVEEKLKQPG